MGVRDKPVSPVPQPRASLRAGPWRTPGIRGVSPERDSAPSNLHFWERLEAEALAHPALNHPWLRAVGEGDCANMGQTLQDFARQYHAYSNAFPRYLQRVIEKLQQPGHRDLLAENLSEEEGCLHESDREKLRSVGIDPVGIDGVTHRQLYRRFCLSLGVRDEELDRPSANALHWRDDMLRFLESASPPAALGALGPGTEYVVKPFYGAISSGIRSLDVGQQIDRRFFDTHCALDGQHADDLRSVSLSFADNARDRSEMRAGMLHALDLRARFLTHLHRQPRVPSGDRPS